MSLDQQSSHPISIEELIDSTEAQIGSLKETIEGGTQATDATMEEVSDSLDKLYTHTLTTTEQQARIMRLQQEYNIIANTADSIKALKEGIEYFGAKKNKPYQPEQSSSSPLHPMVDLDPLLFTEDKVYTNRQGPANKVKILTQSSKRLSSIASGWLSKIGITE